MTKEQRQLNDWIGTLRLAAETQSQALLDGALVALNGEYRPTDGVEKEYQGEFQGFLDDLIYAERAQNWSQIKMVVERLDGAYTTVGA